MTPRTDQERREKWNVAVLALILLVAVTVTLSPSVSAAANAGSPSSAKPKTFLDPFTLNVVTVPSVILRPQVGTPAKPNVGWQPVRIPSRPNPRSAFQPNW